MDSSPLACYPSSGAIFNELEQPDITTTGHYSTQNISETVQDIQF